MIFGEELPPDESGEEISDLLNFTFGFFEGNVQERVRMTSQGVFFCLYWRIGRHNTFIIERPLGSWTTSHDPNASYISVIAFIAIEFSFWSQNYFSPRINPPLPDTHDLLRPSFHIRKSHVKKRLAKYPQRSFGPYLKLTHGHQEMSF